jgi:hypothetical protein
MIRHVLIPLVEAQEFDRSNTTMIIVRINYWISKWCVNKGHIEVYRASVDDLLQFHQLK